MGAQTEIVIVGGGLAGLALADALHRTGRDFILLEARDRLGGRIKATQVGTSTFDLGPAWFWPAQPRMAAMVARFGLRQFDQFAAGALSFEDESGAVQRGRGIASMDGSFRLEGGLITLIDALAAGLPASSLRLGEAVCKVERDDGVIVTTQSGSEFRAKQIVFALPPRIVAGIAFEPSFSEDVMQGMQGVPTWMASQAKALAVYDKPFWRDAGLSGDAIGRFGPMVEVHDATPNDGTLGAVFGFIRGPAATRGDIDGLRVAILAQLGRLFGPQAATPKELVIKDWAYDPLTATDADLAPMYTHPAYGKPAEVDGLWEGRIVFGGTEVAREFGGYLEGALEAAETAFAALQ